MDWIYSAVVLVALGVGFLTGLLSGFVVDAWCLRGPDNVKKGQ